MLLYSKGNICIFVTGMVYLSNGKIVLVLHKVAVLILGSNLDNCFTNTCAEYKVNVWSVYSRSSAQSCPCQFLLLLQSRRMSCNRRRRQQKAESVAWMESSSIRLACGLNVVPECAQAEHTGDNISFSDSSNELHEKIQCVPFHCFFPLSSLHPPISSQGHWKLQTIPACTRRKAMKSLQVFRYTV